MGCTPKYHYLGFSSSWNVEPIFCWGAHDCKVTLVLWSSPGQALVCSAWIAAFPVWMVTHGDPWWPMVTHGDPVVCPRNPPVKGAEIVADELQGGKSDMWRWACCYDGQAWPNSIGYIHLQCMIIYDPLWSKWWSASESSRLASVGVITYLLLTGCHLRRWMTDCQIRMSRNCLRSQPFPPGLEHYRCLEKRGGGAHSAV